LSQVKEKRRKLVGRKHLIDLIAKIDKNFLSPDRRLFVLPALLGRHQGDLLEGIGRRRLLGHELQLQVTEAAGVIDLFIICRWTDYSIPS